MLHEVLQACNPVNILKQHVVDFGNDSSIYFPFISTFGLFFSLKLRHVMFADT